MNRRTFLRGATVALTALGIGAVATAPEAPPVAPVPQPTPTRVPLNQIASNEMVVVPGKPIYEDGSYYFDATAQQLANLYKQGLVPFSTYRQSCSGSNYSVPDETMIELVKVYTDKYLQSVQGKAEIAALAKELMGTV